jgi:hypothetical protein
VKIVEYPKEATITSTIKREIHQDLEGTITPNARIRNSFKKRHKIKRMENELERIVRIISI